MAKEPAPKAQGPDGHEFPSARHVQVTLEMIEVSQADATQLLYKDKLGKDGTKLRAALQVMVDSQKASMLETMMVASHSGTKATSESIREVIYPMEYEPPELPGSFGPPKDGESSPTKSRRPFPPLPTAFETRHTGSMLGIEPAIREDGKIVDLRLAPEIVFEAGARQWNVHKDELGNESSVEMPFFYTIRTNASLTLKNGEPEILCVLTPKNAEGVPDRSRKLLVMLTADVIASTTTK